MQSFLDKGRQDPSVPEWADFFSAEEYSRFMTLLGEYLASQEIAFTTDDEILIVETERYGGSQLGLINLAQSCHQADEEEWPERIEDHFEQLERIHIFDQEFSATVHDFEKIKDALGVRLYHKEYLKHLEPNTTITQQVTEDIIAMLIFDLPYAIKSVNEEDMAPWNKTTDELFKIGIENIKDNYETDLNSQELGDLECLSIDNEHYYSPNVLLDMDSYPEAIGTYGSIVAVPTRHFVLLYPVESLEVVQLINMFAQLVPELYNEGPGSISPNIHWYYKGTFTIIPFTFDEETLRISPPDSFVEVLNQLQNVGERD